MLVYQHLEQTVGIEPTFLAWQANILTVILCLLELGYMATLPRYILAPYQAALILATTCNWPRVYHAAGLVYNQ